MSSPPRRLLLLAVAAKHQEELDQFESSLAAAGLLPNIDIEISIASNRQEMSTSLGTESLLTMPEESSVFQLWAAAVQSGVAPYVALMDAGCPPAAGWWDHAKTAIEADKPIFFGSVVPGWPEKDRRLAGYIIEYAQFNEPLSAHLNEYPGNNIVFQRSLLCTDDFPDDGFRKTFFVNRLLAQGCPRPTPLPKMSVSYMKPYDAIAYRRRRYAHGRAFGAQSGADLGAVRIWYTLRCLALPILRMLRILRAVGSNRMLRQSAARLIGDIALSEFAWSLGEGAGYVLGSASAAKNLN